MISAFSVCRIPGATLRRGIFKEALFLICTILLPTLVLCFVVSSAIYIPSKEKEMGKKNKHYSK